MGLGDHLLLWILKHFVNCKTGPSFLLLFVGLGSICFYNNYGNT